VYRSALSPSLLVAVALFTAVPLSGQQASSACGLLQVGELEAAIGGKASTKPAGSIQSVPGMTLDVCTVVLSGCAPSANANAELAASARAGVGSD